MEPNLNEYKESSSDSDNGDKKNFITIPKDDQEK